MIDKDLASAILAEAISADSLVISTGVEKVCLNYGKPNEQALDLMTAGSATREEARLLGYSTALLYAIFKAKAQKKEKRPEEEAKKEKRLVRLRDAGAVLGDGPNGIPICAGSISFSFGMSSTGKELYIYGAGFEIEIYDAATLKLKRVTDLKNDVTMAGMVVVP